MSVYQTIQTGIHDGFEIRYDFSHEDIPLEDILDSKRFDVDQYEQEINDGALCYFTVTCYAIRDGIKLGRASLGGCLYDSECEFLADDYAADLQYEAINEARQVLNKMIERVA